MSANTTEAASKLAALTADMTESHDAYSFEQLRDAYNFQKTSCWQRTFLRLLAG